MAKLYWRIKQDGKWTWRPAEYTIIERRMDPDTQTEATYLVVYSGDVQ